MIPGAPNNGGRIPHQQNPTTWLLPPWATDADVDKAVNDIILGYRAFRDACDQQTREHGPTLVAQTEAYLTHEAEGW